MKKTELKAIWKNEEKAAHIHGWDFSHIYGRYEAEMDLPWDYEKIIKQYLNDDMNILDYDTGGGEFLLSLKHPVHKTAATEGYQPNVELCKERLLPIGIALYYILKAYIIYKTGKIKHHNNLSDIKEILKHTEKESYLDEDSTKLYRQQRQFEEQTKKGPWTASTLFGPLKMSLFVVIPVSCP